MCMIHLIQMIVMPILCFLQRVRSFKKCDFESLSLSLFLFLFRLRKHRQLISFALYNTMEETSQKCEMKAQSAIIEIHRRDCNAFPQKSGVVLIDTNSIINQAQSHAQSVPLYSHPQRLEDKVSHSEIHCTHVITRLFHTEMILDKYFLKKQIKQHKLLKLQN